MRILAFSNCSADFLEERKSEENTRMFFCGGVEGNTISKIFELKVQFTVDFMIILSPTDINYFVSIINLFRFISKAASLVQGVKRKKIKKPENFLSFISECSSLFEDELTISKIMDGKNVFLDNEEKEILKGLYSYLVEKSLKYNIEQIHYILVNSLIAYEDRNFIFTSENTKIGYKRIDLLNNEFQEELKKIIDEESSKFIRKFIHPPKKAKFPVSSKIYVVGDNMSYFDFPYVELNESNTIIYLKTCGKNISYLERGEICLYTNTENYSYIEIIENEVNCFTYNAKCEPLSGRLETTIGNDQILPQRFGAITTKNYYHELICGYVGLPIKGGKNSIVAKRTEIEDLIVQHCISSLIPTEECSNCNKKFSSIISLLEEKSSLKRTGSEESVLSSTIYKPSDFLGEDSDKEEKCVSFCEELNSKKIDSSDDEF